MRRNKKKLLAAMLAGCMVIGNMQVYGGYDQSNQFTITSDDYRLELLDAMEDMDNSDGDYENTKYCIASYQPGDEKNEEKSLNIDNEWVPNNQYLLLKYSEDIDYEDEGYLFLEGESIHCGSIQNPAISFSIYHDGTASEMEYGIGLTFYSSNTGESIVYYIQDYEYVDGEKIPKTGWETCYIDIGEMQDKVCTMEMNLVCLDNDSKERTVMIDNVALVDMKMPNINPIEHFIEYGEELPTLDCPQEDAVILIRAYDPTTGEVSHYELDNHSVLPESVLGCEFAVETYSKELNAASAVLLAYQSRLICKGVEYDIVAPGEIVLQCPVEDAKIYYSIGIADEYTLYQGENLKLSDGDVLFCYATKEGLEQSSEQTIYAKDVIEFHIEVEIAGKRYKGGSAINTTVKPGDRVKLYSHGGKIWYTTDGTRPQQGSSNLYEDGILISEDTEITAIAEFENGVVGAPQTFRIPVENPDIFEENDSIESATSISLPAKIEANISREDDVDYYRFDVKKDGNLSAIIQSSNGENMILSLYDADGKEIPRNHYAYDGFLTEIQKGTYYLAVSGIMGDYTLQVKNASKSVNVDLSEFHLAKTVQCEQSRFYVGSNADYNTGGYYSSPMMTFSKWQGVVSEEDDPYTDDSEADNFYTYEEAGQQYHIQNIIMKEPRDESKIGTEEDIAYIKGLIHTYGAIDVSMAVGDYTGFSEDCSLYYTTNKGLSSDHEVLLIGYDDNFPKERFAQISGETPEHDGAFIVRNSWGEELGENGCFYVSYESYGFMNDEFMIYLADETVDNYNTIYYYDEIGFLMPTDTNTSSIYLKNVYTAKEDEILKAVSFMSLDYNYIFDVFVQINGGEMEYAGSMKKDDCGYFTQRIKEFKLHAGDEFAVILRATDDSASNVYIAFEDYYSFDNARMAKGQSYVSFDGVEWTDNMDIGWGNNVLKAYTISENPDAAIEVEGVSDYGDIISFPEDEEYPDAVGIQPASKFGHIASDDIYINASNDNAFDSYPARYDLRDYNLVNLDRNQGFLGTCWTFGAIGSIESYIMVTGNQSLNYPKCVTLSAITMDGNHCFATGDIVGENIGSDKLYYSFAGDLDNIEILNYESLRGEQVELFRLKDETKATNVIVTAASAADASRTATTTFQAGTNVEPEEGKDDQNHTEGKGDSNIPSTGNQTGHDGAQTGDKSSMPYIMVTVIAGVLVVLIAVFGKKKK